MVESQAVNAADLRETKPFLIILIAAAVFGFVAGIYFHQLIAFFACAFGFAFVGIYLTALLN